MTQTKNMGVKNARPFYFSANFDPPLFLTKCSDTEFQDICSIIDVFN